jgi:hypothetical protein
MLEEKITQLIASFKDKSSDGKLSVTEILSFIMEALEVLLNEAKHVIGIPKEDRLEIIALALTKVYKTINIDLPYIPEPFETWIETFILDYIVPAVITWMDKD